MKKCLNGVPGTVHTTRKIINLNLETSVLLFGCCLLPRLYVCVWVDENGRNHNTWKEQFSLNNTSIRCQLWKWHIIWATLDHCWYPSLPIFQLILRFSPLVDVKWTHVLSDTPMLWGFSLSNHETRRLRHLSKGCLVSSPPERWPINGTIFWNSPHPRLDVLGCVKGYYDDWMYIYEEGFQSSGALLTTLLGDIFWLGILVVSKTLTSEAYLYRSGINAGMRAK